MTYLLIFLTKILADNLLQTNLNTKVKIPTNLLTSNVQISFIFYQLTKYLMSKLTTKQSEVKKQPEAPKKEAKKANMSGFDPNVYVTKNLDVNGVLKIKECFDIFDTDKSGQVSIEELVNTIKALGLQNDAEKIFNIVTAQTKIEELTFDLWLQVFGFGSEQTGDSMRAVYDLFDARGSGMFTTEDFAKCCESVGEKFTDAEYDQMIEYGDRDRDGGINYEEFIEIVTKEYPKV